LVFGVFPERLKPDAEVHPLCQFYIDLPHKKEMILSTSFQLFFNLSLNVKKKNETLLLKIRVKLLTQKA
jgi:hypothetical protein